MNYAMHSSLRLMRGMLAFFALSVISVVPTTSADLPEGVKVGDAAPSFLLKNIDGKMVGQESFPHAKGIVVVFTCNHCPYAIKYEDRVQALHSKYASQGYPVVAINSNDPASSPEDSYAKMQERAKDKKFTFPYVFDDTQAIAKAYGARRTPHVYVLNRTPKGFVVEYIGAIDDNPDDAAAVGERFVEKAIDALITGAKPSTTFTKAIGCTIKWKKA